MTTIGVAIPCYHGHIKALKNLLDSIENQTRKPDAVVVSCSGTNESDIPYKCEDYSFKLKIISSVSKKNSAQNRNIAALALDTDIISFIDADDKMLPQRIEIIERAFKENDIFFFVHRWTSDESTINNLYDINSIQFDIGKIGISPVGNGCLHLTNNSAYIHNGHCSISKNVFNYIRFGETPKYHAREDSVFVADVINLYPRHTGYCPVALSIYNSTGTLSFVA